MEDVVIYGAGGLGCLVLDIVEQAGRYRPVGFLDSNPQKHGREVNGLPVRGGLEQIETLLREGAGRAVVAVGDNVARVALAETLEAHGIELVSAIHPLASLALSARVERHVIIGPRANICVHAHIGPHCVISAGAIVEHDNRIGQGVFLHPAARLAGGVTVEEFAIIGIGAAVIPGRRVGRGARVDPGAVVIHDVPPNTTVSGIPASRFGPMQSRFVPEQVPGAQPVPGPAPVHAD